MEGLISHATKEFGMDKVATATPAAEAIQRLGSVTLEKPTEQHRLSLRINGEWLDFEVGREIQQSDTLGISSEREVGAYRVEDFL